jgi:uncharacterized protein
MEKYHSGERMVQERAGERDDADHNGSVISDTIMVGARPFIARQMMVAVASVAADGSPWASLWFGPAGFITAQERSVAIDLTRLHRDEHDPAWLNLAHDNRLGLVAIELGSRRRYRINGRVSGRVSGPIEQIGDVLQLEVVEAYPNCPKFIHRRIPHLGQSQTVSSHVISQTLSDDDRRLLANADTTFVASIAPGGMPDASHRGGLAGFIEVFPDGRLRLPDYPGNSMFNTWGNLTLVPRIALVVPDFTHGRLLHIAGRVELQWDQPDPTGRTAGTGRFWFIQPEQVRSATMPVAITWETLEASPLSPQWT